MSSTGNFQGRTVWVTGGAGHLGAAITAALDAAGATVVCIDLPGRAEALVRERGLGNTAHVALDLTDLAAQRAAVPRLIATHGAPHGLVHLPFVSSSGKTLEELSTDDLNRTFTGALTPTFEFCRAAALAMAGEHGGGSIVLFSSMYGLVSPDPRIYSAPMAPNPIDYGASKAALIQMCRYLAVHFGPRGVRFNCLAPGPFPSPAVQADSPRFVAQLSSKTALGRIGRREEITGPALFLLSDASSYITGHTLVVDGGWTVW
ncbi:MAG: SDR family oxidoreductase [Opitutaceae bacterium]|nr:SDR family oxidoreductase [Opitutaceae bacterium]